MLNNRTRLKLEIVLAKLSAVLNIIQSKLIEFDRDFLSHYHLSDHEKSQSDKLARKMTGSLRDSRRKISQIKQIIRN